MEIDYGQVYQELKAFIQKENIEITVWVPSAIHKALVNTARAFDSLNVTQDVLLLYREPHEESVVIRLDKARGCSATSGHS